MIELRHLRTLVALKESGSLAGAAKKRFVTQSALSHQIKELETRINSAIFVRKSKPLAFTHEGARLLNLAEEILPKVIATEFDLKRGLEGTEQQLKLGIECRSGMKWLAPAIEAFQHQVPNTSVEIANKHLTESLNALESGSLDIVLTSAPVPGHTLAYQHLFDVEIKLVVANDNPLASQVYVTPAQLADTPLLSFAAPLNSLDIYKYFLEPAGIKPGEQKQCELSSVLVQRVACNDGVAALPAWSLKELQGLGVSAVKLGAEGLKKPVFGAYRRDATNANLIQKWLELVAQEGLQLQRVN
ncbi:LysR substrate-binding domain-containing protein [Shewanella aestuarii]|uniref:LysR family transcriptional regulator n=1 Tax=Shewanella aestuarii TaxID=1028752 RepID=A0A6G9QLU9_9GAMM|nr:LysR substrate-binding domain-containing protein [Shewanella aestuarii]QIR15452.1 LysR family transcriptional regulator [Shewanella aestuarii]